MKLPLMRVAAVGMPTYTSTSALLYLEIQQEAKTAKRGFCCVC
jgi:hypothetical protein